MDPFLIFLTVVISLLTIVMLVVSIQVILILRKVNHSLSRANQTFDTASNFLHSITNPLSDVKALGQGIKTGLFVAEHITVWLKNRKQEADERPTE